MSRWSSKAIWGVVILCLAAIGLVIQLIYNTGWLLLIIAVVGLIYYLYKKPPVWLIRMTQSPGYRGSSHKKKESSQNKRRSFRVIQGNKKDRI